MKTKIVLISMLVFVFSSICFAQTPSQLFQQALLKENGEGDLKAAVEIYQKIVDNANADRSIRAKALLHIGFCWEKMGKETAERTYQRLIEEFSDQSNVVNEARNRLANLKLSTDEKTSGLSIKKIWTDFKIIPKNLLYNSVSPNGKHFLAIHYNGDFCRIDLDSKKIKYLTNYKEQEKEFYKKNPSQAEIDSFYNSQKIAAGAAWSKDGKKFIYTWCNWNGKNAELRIMTLDRKIEKTYSNFQDLTWPVVLDWSNNQEDVLLIAATDKEDSKLLIFNLSSQTLTYLKKIDQLEERIRASFSSNGQFIAYDIPVKEHQGKKDIYLYDLKNDRETLLIENVGEDHFFGWMPDGRILFASDRSGTYDAWSIRVKEGTPNGDPVLVKKNIGEIYSLGISINNTFYFANENKTVDIYQTILSKNGKKVDKKPIRITDQFIGNNTIPSWSPDGTRLAFLSNRGLQRDDLHIIIQQNGNSNIKKEHSLRFKEIQSVNWDLDGKTLLLTGINENDQTGIFKLGLANSTIKPVYLFPEKELYTSWAAQLPGVDKIIFVHRPYGNDPESKIMFLDLVSKQVGELDRVSTWPVNAILTPDKKHIAFREWREQKEYIYQIPVSGGEREIIAEFKNEYLASFVWSPDVKKLYFVKGNYQDGARSLWVKDFDNDKMIDLGIKMNFIRGLQLHPDGQKLLFQAGEVNFELWTMENF